MRDKVLEWLQKRGFLLVSIAMLIVFLSGCATWKLPGLTYQQEQYDLLTREIEIKKDDYDKRLNEIEKAYIDDKLTEGEYLILKNNLKQEWAIYCASVDQRISYITQNAIRRNHPY